MVTRPTGGLLEAGPDGHFAQDVTNTTGLVFAVYGGFYVARTDVNEIEASTVTLADDDVSQVYLDLTTMTVASTIAATPPSTDSIHLFEVTAASGVITVVTEKRHRQYTTNDVVKV